MNLSPVALIVSLIVSLIFIFVVLAVAMAVLAVSGGPGQCTPGGGAITIDAANAAAFKQKWDALDAALNTGSPSSATFNESEVSSRADQFIDDETDGRFKDVRICLHDSKGEGSATLDLFAGLEAEVKVTGTMDLTGAHPVAKIDDIEVGNVPGFVTGLVEGVVEDAIKEALNKIDLKHTYTPAIAEGSAQVDGQP